MEVANELAPSRDKEWAGKQVNWANNSITRENEELLRTRQEIANDSAW